MIKIFKKSKLITLTITFICFFGNSLFASISLIRDAEIEDFLYELSKPIIISAGLNPENVKIYIINDNNVNAFVSGGQNIFVNTGLIVKYKTPDALIGVISHEIGHIKAGHIVHFEEGLDDAKKALMLSYILGAGAMAAGSYDAGSALIMGGTHIAGRMQQKYTREQEEAADQYALKYLDELNYPADGLLILLQHFKDEFKPYADMIDEYALSHPISQKRIDLIKNRTKNNNFSNKKINEKLQSKMNIVLAKIESFTSQPSEILDEYKDSNDQLIKYKKSIAYHRYGKSKMAIDMINDLISREIANDQNIFNIGFLYELKAQFLFESGDIENSLIFYNEAIKNLSINNSNLAKIALAGAINALQTRDLDLINLSLSYLLQAKIYEKENPSLYLNLAKIYDKLSKEGDSFLALANYYLLINNYENAKKFANKAKKIFENQSDNEDKIIEINDILEVAKEKK